MLDRKSLKLNQASPTLFEMLNIPVEDNGDSFVSLKKAGFPYLVFDEVVPPSTGDDIFVRQGVLSKLEAAQSILKTIPDYEDCHLEVTYGFRSPDIQHQKYIEQLERFYKPCQDPQVVMEMANNYIACPHTAGHPSGAAIDIWITDAKGEALEFGSSMHDLSEASSVYNKNISKLAYENRLVLRACMMAAGFTPYNGEWWHFSYGDREHALWSGNKTAFYAPHSFTPDQSSFEDWEGIHFNYINFVQDMGENNE